MTASRLSDLPQFYQLLDLLIGKTGGMRTLAASSGRLDWPRRGVYFFFENGEARSESGVGPRVVRIGTHALREGSGTRLWGRLSQHRGQARHGSGNHRGSIFRLLVGTALIARDGYECRTWGGGGIAPAAVRIGEADLEREVSGVIGKMPFAWLAAEDEPGASSLRGYIERNAIALLSNFGRDPLDRPSASWLGNHCNRERVRRSGLWNQNHVDETHDPAFLACFERLIGEMSRLT